jgi:hypothetical protein
MLIPGLLMLMLEASMKVGECRFIGKQQRLIPPRRADMQGLRPNYQGL